MKKKVFLLWSLLFLVFIPSISAEINVNGPGKTKVSLGEDIQLSGYVLQSSDMFGLFKFELVCNERETVLIKSISLKASVQKEFSESIAMNEFLEGSCVVEAFLEVNSAKVESAQSSPFALTRELLGEISLDKTSVQLGEEITIAGVISRPDSSKVSGSAKIIFKKDDIVFLQQVVPVTKGKFSYSYDTKDNPAGTYKVEIEVADAYNNKQVFVVEDFTILGAITLTAEISKTEFLPEESMKISGTALAGDVKVKEGVVSLLFNEEEFEAKISRGNFKFTVPIAKTIKSGAHNINILAEDSFGNRKEVVLEVSIIPVPTEIKVVTNSDALEPTSQLTIHPSLVDQAGDLLVADLEVVLFDADKVIVFEEVVKSNEQTALTLPEDAIPGSWKLVVQGLDVTNEKVLSVLERGSTSFVVDGEVLTIANKGNVVLEESFVITFASSNELNNREMVKEVKLRPGKSVSVDLARGTNPGVYTVSVGGRSFEGVSIVKSKSSFVIPWNGIFVGIIVIVVLWFLFKRKGSSRRRRHRTHQKQHKRHRSDSDHVQKFRQDISERVDKLKTPLHFNFKKRDDEFIMELPKKKVKSSYTMPREVEKFNDSREPVWKDPEPNESEKVDPFKGEEEKDVPEKKKGLFNMFDW
tara:strand:+ start:22844 stop:24763 length:1920 start_codon:yes stop_codon:yes gene_type:complete